MTAPRAAFEAWALRRLAQLAGTLGRRARARELWSRLLDLRPDDASVLEALAHLDTADGRRVEAIALLERALAIDPGVARPWFNLGFLLQEQGEHERAIAAFDRALALDAGLDRALYGKALSLRRLVRTREAVPVLQRNTELQLMSPYGWYQLGHAFHRLGEAERLADVIRKLSQFEPAVAKRLRLETGAEPRDAHPG